MCGVARARSGAGLGRDRRRQDRPRGRDHQRTGHHRRRRARDRGHPGPAARRGGGPLRQRLHRAARELGGWARPWPRGHHAIRRRPTRVATTASGSSRGERRAAGRGNRGGRRQLGQVYIADEINGRIRKVDAFGTITSVAAGLNGPLGVTVARDDTVYASDSSHNRVVRITPAGLLTVAGTGAQGYNGDGIPATAGAADLPQGRGDRTPTAVFSSPHRASARGRPRRRHRARSHAELLAGDAEALRRRCSSAWSSRVTSRR